MNVSPWLHRTGLPFTAIVFLLIIIPVGFAIGKPCIGEDNCKVCVNCTECKYCTPDHHCNVWEEYNAKIKRESEAPSPEQPTNWLGVFITVCAVVFIIWNLFFNTLKPAPLEQPAPAKEPDPTIQQQAADIKEEHMWLEEQFGPGAVEALKQMYEEEQNQPPLDKLQQQFLESFEQNLRRRAIWRIDSKNQKPIRKETVEAIRKITAKRPWPSDLERRVARLLERDLKTNPPPEE